jgi:GNAT superfamily N-acetyltransferase
MSRDTHSPLEWTRGAYTISTDPARLQVERIHAYLSGRSYWASGIPIDVVRESLRNSLCFGLYAGDLQVGFARVVTDLATFAYLADVYVLDEHRGQGLGVWLAEVVTGHPRLQGLRRWMLATRDAHTLYQKVGFTPLKDPARLMEKLDPGVYQRPRSEPPA